MYNLFRVLHRLAWYNIDETASRIDGGKEAALSASNGVFNSSYCLQGRSIEYSTSRDCNIVVVM
jgi:hypothetical protein